MNGGSKAKPTHYIHCPRLKTFQSSTTHIYFRPINTEQQDGHTNKYMANINQNFNSIIKLYLLSSQNTGASFSKKNVPCMLSYGPFINESIKLNRNFMNLLVLPFYTLS